MKRTSPVSSDSQGILGPVLGERMVEASAQRIENPIDRLKYLRRVASRPKRRPSRTSLWQQVCAGALVLVALVLALAGFSQGSIPRWTRTTEFTARPLRRPSQAQSAAAAPAVWLVERKPEFELYSNGLRIERDFLTASRPRLGRVLRRLPAGGLEPAEQAKPAGIVFHSSESETAPFEPSHSDSVRRQSIDLLAHVRRGHLYNFVIDRFGRVHRILEDSEKADHAGYSIWANSDFIYLNLNESFLGVSFEARDENQAPHAQTLSAAQLHAGRVLTEMLRSMYQIPAANCVTHAQVSVNPSNFRVGYHTDWAANFPFEEFGLESTYREPLPSVSLFGFEYDDQYVQCAGPPLRSGLPRAEEEVRRAAELNGLSPNRYRLLLRERYLRFTRELFHTALEKG